MPDPTNEYLCGGASEVVPCPLFRARRGQKPRDGLEFTALPRVSLIPLMSPFKLCYLATTLVNTLVRVLALVFRERLLKLPSHLLTDFPSCVVVDVDCF